MRTSLRTAAVLCLAVLLAGCDKCGNFNFNVPKVPGACSDARPRV
jgi:hypothetical protein